MFRKAILFGHYCLSYFVCPSYSETSDIFGTGGANQAEGSYLCRRIPLDMDIRATSDAGTPIVAESLAPVQSL